jgi:hypothetical protein
MGMEKYTSNRTRFFLCKKYTTFSAERIVAILSVNNFFLESYDFTASEDLKPDYFQMYVKEGANYLPLP